MMNYEEFKQSIVNQIRDVLPEKYRDADVEVRPLEKINQSYEALFVGAAGENLSVGVNLEQYYDQYDAGDMDFQETLSAVSERLQEDPGFALDVDSLRNYETIKEQLYIRVCGVEQNQELLQNIPHRVKEDLAVTYHLHIGETEDGLAASAMVTDDFLTAYGITEEQLHQDALENSQKLFPATLTPVRDMLQELLFGNLKEPEIQDPMVQLILDTMVPQDAVPMYVLTNEQKLDGAGVLFYPDMMDQIGNVLGNDYIILPSSTQEMIILPDQGMMTAREAQEMVADINGIDVPPEERLTDCSYHYDRETHLFEKFSSYEARMEEKEKEAELDDKVPQKVESSEERSVPNDFVRHEKQERNETSRTGSERAVPKRESVLKKLEEKKAAVKAREAERAKDRTRGMHNRSDHALG
ncbi:MAG: DUF5688 family protein [Clostridiales bacterium]|nr:DUF5688 family protein [Clostridiales bacterium]